MPRDFVYPSLLACWAILGIKSACFTGTSSVSAYAASSSLLCSCTRLHLNLSQSGSVLSQSAYFIFVNLLLEEVAKSISRSDYLISQILTFLNTIATACFAGFVTLVTVRNLGFLACVL